MDISEIWDNLGYLVAPIVAFLLFRLARRIPRNWLRISARAVAIVFFLIAGVALICEGYWLFCLTERRPAIFSPDGRHVAVTRWTVVLFDVNYLAEAHISIRSRFNPFAKEVFADQVVTRLLSDLLKDPDVRWLDDHRLLISSRSDGQVKDCSPGPSRIDGIEVLCQK
jgi:hypothetical protein